MQFNMNFKRTRLAFLILAIILLLPSIATALSTEDQIARYGLAFKKAMSAGDYKKALSALDKLKKFNVDLGEDVIYYEAKALAGIGQHSKALKKVNEYVERAGSNGFEYENALELYDELENKIGVNRQINEDFKEVRHTLSELYLALCTTPIEINGPTEISPAHGVRPERKVDSFQSISASNCKADGTFSLQKLYFERTLNRRNAYSTGARNPDYTDRYGYTLIRNNSPLHIWQIDNARIERTKFFVMNFSMHAESFKWMPLIAFDADYLVNPNNNSIIEYKKETEAYTNATFALKLNFSCVSKNKRGVSAANLLQAKSQAFYNAKKSFQRKYGLSDLKSMLRGIDFSGAVSQMNHIDIVKEDFSSLPFRDEFHRLTDKCY